MLQSKDCLKQPCNTGCVIQMADIPFHRADGAKLILIRESSERLRDSIHLNRIA
ncbi:hypothetical protein D3C84_1135500 [compost metagenome]